MMLRAALLLLALLPIDDLTPAQYAADLDFLLQELERVHPDLYHARPKTDWQADVQALRASLDDTDLAHFYIGVQRLVALAEDGHTRSLPPHDSELFSKLFPVRFQIFSDGVYITAAAPQYAEIVGGRVREIGTTSIEDVLTAIDPLCAADNASGRLADAERFLSFPSVHHVLGFSDQPFSSRLLLEVGPRRVEVVLEKPEPGPPYALMGVTPEGWPTALKAEAPLWLRHPEKRYWFEYDESEGLVFFQFNEVQDDPAEPFSAFCDRLFQFIEEHDVQKLVIDIRRNSGGNGYLNQPLVHGLIRSRKLDAPGRIFVITGRQTFSAALMTASAIESNTKALFVGEPTAGSPNHYGDASRFRLPNTGLMLMCSTLFWQTSDPRDDREAIAPDIPTPLSFVQWSKGIDPALAAIRYCTPAEAERLLAGTYGNRAWRRPRPDGVR
ncbi:MAG: S41 family peptidase [Planctomycetota bacterium]